MLIEISTQRSAVGTRLTNVPDLYASIKEQDSYPGTWRYTVTDQARQAITVLAQQQGCTEGELRMTLQRYLEQPVKTKELLSRHLASAMTGPLGETSARVIRILHTRLARRFTDTMQEAVRRFQQEDPEEEALQHLIHARLQQEIQALNTAARHNGAPATTPYLLAPYGLISAVAA